MKRLKEILGRILKIPCQHYGGTMPDGRTRLCSKWRWHTDSHTYFFESIWPGSAKDQA